MNDSKNFQDAESVRSGNSHVTSRPMSFPNTSDTWRDVEAFFRIAAPQGRAAKHLGHTRYIGKRFFADPLASSSAPYPQELNPWGTTIEEPLHMSTAEKSERPEQNRDLKCQSGPSAKDSVIFSGGDSSKNYGADQQRLQISDLHFDKFPTPATFACWKIRFKTEVCTCSQFLRKQCNGSKKWSWLIQWMNWDLRHLPVVFQCRILKYLMRGLLQHWTKSSILPISKEESVWRNKRPRSRTVSFAADRLLTWSTITSGSLEPWFCRKLHRPIHYCSTKWRYSGIRF